MARSRGNKIELTAYDDLFETDESRAEKRLEKIQIVPASEVFPYERQPYSVKRVTKDLIRLMDSIGRRGIEDPLIVRPREKGGYEIISGHRRNYCAEVQGIPDRPVIVRNYSDDEADILVADFNITREELLPSEIAKAYKLRYDAMKRQGHRTDLTSGQIAQKLGGQSARQQLAEIVGKTEDEVRRYLRLNELIPEILKIVDDGLMKIRPASDISYLKTEEQMWLYQCIDSEVCTPSVAQAIRLKELSKQGKLTECEVLAIMQEEKPNQREKPAFRDERITKLIPKTVPKGQETDFVVKALEFYNRHLQRSKDRER